MGRKHIVKEYRSGGHWQVLRIGVIRQEWFGGVCMWNDCDITKDLEFAHAIQTELSLAKKSHRSSRERLDDLMNNPECFLLFCPLHHRVYDNRDGDDWKADLWRN